MLIRSLFCLTLGLLLTLPGCSGNDSLADGSFQTRRDSSPTAADSETLETAILAGGCFWCVESDFEKLPGVVDVISGYSEGTNDNPTYGNYSKYGHVEVVKVVYDPGQVTFAGLVEWLIKHSDPTDANGSFVDRGKQYAPVVYYHNDAQKKAAASVIEAVDAMNVYDQKLDLRLAKEAKFWPAEDYHQDYHSKSFVKYDLYRYRSGRDAFIKKVWGDRAKKLELEASVPAPAEEMPTEDVMADETGQDETGKDETGEEKSSDRGIARQTASTNPWDDFLKPAAEELKKKLSDEQYQVTQQEGTERAFQNEYWDNKRAGIYVDIVSGEPLFSSADKYKSGTGWPSFVQPLSSDFITLEADNRMLATRTEVRSKIGDSHLGHVFNDGPASRGGKRWCMNSAAMKFIPKEEMQDAGYGDYLSDIDP
jgi:peptide methionine sulfoxide reductase msrA/msrB